MVNAKRKTRDLPKLPADHLTLYADQIHSLHVEKQNDAEWLLLIYLKDNRALRIWIGARSADKLWMHQGLERCDADA